jgi:Iap family predicted aminopeptidase
VNGDARDIRFSLVPRPVVEARLGQYGGTNRERQATLKQMFVEAGCGEHVTEQQVKSRPPNVICTLPGSSGRVIIVGAHFDKVFEGDGVADNWTGASLLPSLYQAIKIEPRQHTYIFIGFTEEEIGLVGSDYYARRMTREEVAATDAMVNMDTLGLASTNIWVSRSDKKLVEAFAKAALLANSPVEGVNFERVGSTDSESFARRRIPRITIHSLNQRNHDAGILHTKEDKLSVVHLDEFYETYRVVTVYLVYLDHYFDEPKKPAPPGK